MTRSADVPLEPWDRQDDEPARCYAGFRQYLEMGVTRSLRKQARLPDAVASWDSITRWSAKYEWVDRSRAWDGEQDRMALLEQSDKIREMRRAHAAIGTVMLSKAHEKLQHVKGADLSIRDAVMLAELGAKLERQARGDAVEIPDSATEDVESENMTSAELWRVLSANPHLADATRALEEALLPKEVEPPPLAGDGTGEDPDDEVVVAELVEDAS